MLRPDYIVIHTAAHGSHGIDFDTTAAEIDSWHRANGWLGIGYHFVVRKNGAVEKGRSLWLAGAHAKGLNSRSIGICCSGHGDISPLTMQQLDGLLALVRRLQIKYDIMDRNVIGHRELNHLVDIGILGSAYRTTKTCPGNQVDMDVLRRLLSE